MKIKTISVTYERKFNLGDYNSLLLGATSWADLEEGEDAESCLAALQGAVREAVKREYLRVKPKSE